MASCAACLQPLLTSQRFLLDGTEVFHASCIGRAYASKLKVAEQRVRELELQLTQTRRSAARVEVEANRLRNETASRHAEQFVLAGRVDNLQRELDLAQERLEMKLGELQGGRNQNAALRAEIVKVQGEAGISPESEADDTDASEIRFKLLEMD